MKSYYADYVCKKLNYFSKKIQHLHTSRCCVTVLLFSPAKDDDIKIGGLCVCVCALICIYFISGFKKFVCVILFSVLACIIFSRSLLKQNLSVPVRQSVLSHSLRNLF